MKTTGSVYPIGKLKPLLRNKALLETVTKHEAQKLMSTLYVKRKPTSPTTHCTKIITVTSEEKKKNDIRMRAAEPSCCLSVELEIQLCRVKDHFNFHKV